MKLEIEEFVRDSFLDTSRAPMVAVSALTGAGLEELKKEIARLTVEIPSRDTETLFRLPIDRVFVMKGFGAVVTGTLIAGKVRKEEEVVVFPNAAGIVRQPCPAPDRVRRQAAGVARHARTS